MNPEMPFARTTCACAECVQCCRDQPGCLIPGDMERIAAHLGETLDEAKRHFWSSPGALLMDRQTGRQFRVRTITPKREHGRCVFLDEQDRCRVHAVAPAGCAHFDVHMSAAQAKPRSVEMVIRQQDPAYQALRQTLDVATSYKPKRY